MKTFAYIYRDLSGALKSGSIQATDRTDAIRQFAAKGYLLVSIVESKHQSPQCFSRWITKRNKFFAGLVAVAACLLSLFWVWQITIRENASPTHSTVFAEKNSASSIIKPVVKKTASVQSPATQKIDTVAVMPRVFPVKEVTAAEMKSLQPTSAPPLQPETTSKKEPLPTPPFNTGTEQFLSIIASTPSGVPMAPLPDLSGMENDFTRASTNTLVIYNDDSEELAKNKEDVAWAKLDLETLVKQGWKPDEVMNEIVKQHNDDANLRYETSQALKRLVDEKAYPIADIKNELNEVNKEMVKRGMESISLDEIGVSEE